MSDNTSIVNVDTSGLGKPAAKSVSKLFNLLGIERQPALTGKQAKADLKATIYNAQAEAQASSIRLRAQHAQEIMTIRHQQNIEKITKAGIHQLHLSERSSADPDGEISDDWLDEFINSAKRFSNEEMQVLWGKLLAGELQSPGRFSPRAIAIVKQMDQQLARDFYTLCSLVSRNQAIVQPFLFSKNNDGYETSLDITYSMLVQLESIGLIKISDDNFTYKVYKGEDCILELGKRKFKISSKVQSTVFLFGCVAFTNVGETLSTICDTEFSERDTDIIVKNIIKHSPQNTIEITEIKETSI